MRGKSLQGIFRRSCRCCCAPFWENRTRKTIGLPCWSPPACEIRCFYLVLNGQSVFSVARHPNPLHTVQPPFRAPLRKGHACSGYVFWPNGQTIGFCRLPCLLSRPIYSTKCYRLRVQELKTAPYPFWRLPLLRTRSGARFVAPRSWISTRQGSWSVGAD